MARCIQPQEKEQPHGLLQVRNSLCYFHLSSYLDVADGKLWLYGGVRNGLEQDDMYYFDVQQGSWAVVISPTLDPAPQLDPVYGSVQGAPNDVNTTGKRINSMFLVLTFSFLSFCGEDQLPAARGFAHGWALQPNTESKEQTKTFPIASNCFS